MPKTKQQILKLLTPSILRRLGRMGGKTDTNLLFIQWMCENNKEICLDIDHKK